MRRLGVTAAMVAVSLLAAACSGGDGQSAERTRLGPSSDQTTTSPSAWNPNDALFAQLMVPHSGRSLEIAQIVLDKEGLDPRVVELATSVKAVQQPQVEQLTAWLDEWGYEVQPEMGHPDEAMVSDIAVQELREASGPDADRMFLEQMILQHQGAIAIAQTQVGPGDLAGAYPDAVSMATAIIDTQSAEITVMQQLLDTL